MIKTCPICGRKFENGHRKYCSVKCSKQGARINNLNLQESRAKTEKKNMLKKSALQETARAAREAGMSYGQYVAMQNQAACIRKERKA